jgi:hypothetical protein
LKLVLSGYWDTANLENMATVRIPVWAIISLDMVLNLSGLLWTQFKP